MTHNVVHSASCGPTYCAAPSMLMLAAGAGFSCFAAMLGRESNGEWKRPEEARDFFRNMIQKDGDNVDLMRMVLTCER